MFSAISSAREDMRRLSCYTIDTSTEEETRWAVCMFLVPVCHIIESSSTISSSDLRRTSWRTTDCPMAGPRRSNSSKTLSTNCNNILIYRWVRSDYSVISLCPLPSRCCSIENTVLCMIIRLFFSHLLFIVVLFITKPVSAVMKFKLWPVWSVSKQSQSSHPFHSIHSKEKGKMKKRKKDSL